VTQQEQERVEILLEDIKDDIKEVEKKLDQHMKQLAHA